MLELSTAIKFDHLPIYDHALALERVNAQDALARELFAMLQQALPDDKKALYSAYNNPAHAGLRAQLHKMYGAVLYCGVPRLEATLHHLQTLVKANACQTQIDDAWRYTLEVVDATMHLNISGHAT